jgi:MEMO1 family protein
MKYRQPVVSGSFYPADADELRSTLAQLFATPACLPVTEAPDEAWVPKALIVPHAGYCYSGEIAAAGFACLQGAEHITRRVLLLGPSHRLGFEGCAICSHDFFTTPLGNLHVDRDACEQLLDAGLVQLLDEAHQWEHSLEVQLPFLQFLLPAINIVPLVVGDCRPDIITAILEVYADSADTRFIISSDLSHYYSDDEARRRDGASIDKILALQGRLHPQDACGCHAINGLLAFCHAHPYRPHLVASGNSGEYSGDRDRVVGYASFALY